MGTEPAAKREIQGVGGVKIGGAPVAYVAIMAAIVAVLAFVPASVVVGGMGGGWPLHDVLHPVIGLLLGPVAGPVASGVGMLVGMLIAPYTSLGPWSPILGIMSAFSVGMVVQRGSALWLAPWLITAALHVLYWLLCSRFGIGFGLWISNTFTVTVALVLIAIPPLRQWAVATIQEVSLSWRTGVALYLVLFFGSTAGIQALWIPNWLTNPWPAEVWPVLIPIILIERLVFTLIGTIVAFGVIPALRRSTFVKPALAGY
jgi:ECF-type riboflavin transporter, S component